VNRGLLAYSTSRVENQLKTTKVRARKVEKERVVYLGRNLIYRPKAIVLAVTEVRVGYF